MTTTTDRMPGLTDILGRWLSRKSRRGGSEKEASGESTASSVTTGGGFEHKPVVVWTAPHQLEARIVQGRLKSEGIPAIIQGDAMGDILGIASGGLAETDVLVPAALADRAFDILESDEVPTMVDEP